MEMRISREMVENQHGHERPRDGFLEPHNGVVARGPAKEGSDRKRVVWPISSGSPPGDDNNASEDGIKRVPTGRAKDVNFSHFLRPALIQVTKPRCGGLRELGCSSGLIGKARVTGAQHQTSGPEQMVDISPDADPSGNLCPDKRFLEPSSSMIASNLEGKRAQVKRVPTGRAKDVNFSHFLRPALIKVTIPRCGGLRELGCSSGLIGKTRVTGVQHQTSGPEQMVDIPPDADPSGNLCPDKRFLEPLSSMIASNLEGKRAQGVEMTRVPAISVCSHGASNEPIVYPKRRYEDCRSSSQSDSDSEDSGRFDRAAGTKECWSSAHRSSERSRRGRINKKLCALQELLPNCDKVDQTGVLDKAIEYLKTLQQQLLVLSSGSPMYLSPPMMLPAGIQQMYAPYRTQIPTFHVPRGMSLGLQFPTRTAALGLQPVPPFVPSSLGRSSSPSLSLDSSHTVDDLDSSYQSGSSSDDQS